MAIHFNISRFLSSFFLSLVWSLNLLLFLYTLLLYYLLHWLPVEHWSAGMLLITMPLAWAFNLLFVMFWLLTHPWRAALSGMALLLGLVFEARTFSWNAPQSNTGNLPTFNVLSYNVMHFASSDGSPKVRRVNELNMTDWVLHQDAPIKCFQEFYNSPTNPTLRMIDRLWAAGYHYYLTLQQPDASGFIGVALFSRYPIVRHGQEDFKTFNGLIWADIKINEDTVRIINVHMQSMGIRVGHVLQQQEMAGVKHETKGILSALRDGFIARRLQVRVVERYVAQSPYPVVVTGDFNDTPYSVVYERLRRRLQNAFEDGGRGFGFSYNRLPGFIRIDNQFYNDQKLTLLNFETFKLPYSDHYPIKGTYGIK